MEEKREKKASGGSTSSVMEIITFLPGGIKESLSSQRKGRGGGSHCPKPQ